MERKVFNNEKDFKTEMELKNSLIKTRNAIRKKYKDLHSENLEIGRQSSRKYKPIIEPLKNFINKNQKEDSNQTKSEPSEKVTPLTSKLNTFDVFKTALPAYQRKLFTTIPEASTSVTKDESFQSPNMSGIHDLDSSIVTEKQDDDDDIEQKIYKKVKSASKTQQDNIYGIRSQHGELYMGKEPIQVKEIDSQMKYCIRRKKFPLTPGLTDLLLLNNPKYYTDKDLQAYKEMLIISSAHKVNYKPTASIRSKYS